MIIRDGGGKSQSGVYIGEVISRLVGSWRLRLRGRMVRVWLLRGGILRYLGVLLGSCRRLVV